MDLSVVAGVIVIGFIHGVLPDHGWPIAATYALGRKRRWLHGTVAGLVLGVGHLISSVVLVLAYFWFSQFAAFAEGPWMRYLAGTMLILLGVYEYRNGGHGEFGHDHDHDNHDHHDHDSGHGHDHAHDGGHEHHDHGHDHHGHDHHDHTHAHDDGYDHHDHHAHDSHDHHDHHAHDSHDHHDTQTNHTHADAHAAPPADTATNGILTRIQSALPGGGGHQHLREEHAERGLYALGVTALLLGFAHEEPIQILAICVGTAFCLELMLIYSIAVIIAILVPTLLLIAGYESHRETVEQYTPYLPTITAVVLVTMGLAFITGLI